MHPWLLRLIPILLVCVGCHTAPLPAPLPTSTAPANRDPHGNPDVVRYIGMLEAPSRLETLQVATVVERLAPAPDAVIGDLGCGPGSFAVAFAAAAPRGLVYAADVEPAQLDALRAKIAGDKYPNIVPVLASFDDPHFPLGRMNLVFIGDTYHHLQDRVAYLSRLKACLAPQGRLAILDYKPGDQPVGPPKAHKLEPGVMERELRAAGWKQVAKYDTHPWHDFEVWVPAQTE
jgi:SAM-dependent methyltransferase